MLKNPLSYTPLHADGTPGKWGRHIIGKGLRLHRGKLMPAELHATKGWRFVPK